MQNLEGKLHLTAEMLRRRLRLCSYSDEEEEEEDETGHQGLHDLDDELYARHDNPSSNPVPNPNPNPNHLAEPVTISDDDDEFVDVSDDINPPSPPPAYHSPPQQQLPVQPESISGCRIEDFLLRMGLKLKRDWLESCISNADGSVRNLDVAAKAKFCFQQFLFSDMNYSGGGLLPPNVDSMHCVDLAGPFVLQVDEIINISCPLKGRYQEVAPGIKRCLKLSMTDGAQRVFGMEYRPIKDLQVLAPAGLKVVICNVHIRHGILMLVPEALEVLGGMVDDLEAARQRLVAEVNKPPRGRRSRNGVVSPLTTRATMSAWPRDGVTFPGNTDSSADVNGPNDSSATFISSINDFVNVQGQSTNSLNTHGHGNISVDLHGRDNSSINIHGHSNNSNFLGPANSTILQGAEVVAPGNETDQTSTAEFAAAVSSVNTTLNPSSNVVSNAEEMQIDASFDRENVVSDEHSSVILNHEDANIVDEFDHPLILSGEREIPFTYLASLSAKWTAMRENTTSVRGKIKCFLTGVKGFQYKQRTTYDLQVYVDDGSLISEILIDHNVVQKGIGHSPEEVTAALSSSDGRRVRDMKETLKQFQIFLVNFEGIMLIEMNRTSPLPLALEMNQGCPATDAWLLIRRLKSSAPAQTPQQPVIDPVDLSP